MVRARLRRWLAVALLALTALGACGQAPTQPKGSAAAPPAPADVPARPLPAEVLKDNWTNTSTAAGLDESARLKLHADRVVVFKDGHALVVKKAKGKVDGSGLLFTDEVPDDAVMGSFWATTEGDNPKLLGMRAEWVNSQRQRTREVVATSIEGLLRANEGQPLTLRVREADQAGGKEQDLPCRVLRVLDNPQVIESHSADVLTDDEPGRRLSLDHAGADFVLISLGDSTQQVLPIAQVTGVSGAAIKTTTPHHDVLRQRTKRLVFDIGTDRAGQEVELSVIYFRSGFRWVPTYRIDEQDAARVTMSLQAELINDAEAIDNAQIDLVVGVPNIRFSDMRSPLALESAMRNTYASSGYGRGGYQSQRMDNNNFSNAYFGNDLQAQAFRGPEDPLTDASASLGEDSQQWTARFDGGTQQMDLFVYNAGRLSLGKGGRATLPLWTSDAPKQDIFGVDFDVQRSAHCDSTPDSGGGSLTQNKVWRYMVLQNSSPVPWTTGPALMMRGGSPLAQDLMTYTAPSRAVRLPVTIATNVIATYADEELERTPGATSVNFHSYTRLRRRVSVTVRNNSDKPATVEVKLGAGGKADMPTDGGRVVTSDFRASDWSYSPGDTSSLNSHSDVRWDVTLQPGEEKAVSARFTYFAY